MALFRRNNEAVTPEPAATTVDPVPTGKKDRPTPTRKEAEAARRQRMTTTLSKKEARAAASRQTRAQRLKAVSAREAAPEKVLMRDYIDARFNLGEFLLPAVVVILLVTVVGSYWPSVALISTLAMYLFILGVFVDGFLMWRGFKKMLGLPAAQGVTKRPVDVRHGAQHSNPAVPITCSSNQARRGVLRGILTRGQVWGEVSMEYRHLGRSGLKVSAVSYGNWITHGSQLEAERATACVRAALDAGITTFDTADVYANGRAETILGDALAGERREGLEICTKVYFPTGPGPNDTGLSRKHIHEAINASLTAAQDRLCGSLPSASLRLRDATERNHGRPSPTWSKLARLSISASASGQPSNCARHMHWRLICASRWSPTSRGTTPCTASSRPRWCRRARSSASARLCSPRWSRAS